MKTKINFNYIVLISILLNLLLRISWSVSDSEESLQDNFGDTILKKRKIKNFFLSHKDFLKNIEGEDLVDSLENRYYLETLSNPECTVKDRNSYNLGLIGPLENKQVNLNYSLYNCFNIERDCEIKLVNSAALYGNYLYFSIKTLSKNSGVKEYSFFIDPQSINFEKFIPRSSVLIFSPVINTRFEYTKNYDKSKIDREKIRPLFSLHGGLLSLLRTRQNDFICFYIPYNLYDNQAKIIGRNYRCVLFNVLSGIKYELPMNKYPQTDQEWFLVVDTEGLAPDVKYEDKVKNFSLGKDKEGKYSYNLKKTVINGLLPIYSLHRSSDFGEECLNISYYNYLEEDINAENQHKEKWVLRANNKSVVLRMTDSEDEKRSKIYIIKTKDIKNKKKEGYNPLNIYSVNHIKSMGDIYSDCSLNKENMAPYQSTVFNCDRIRFTLMHKNSIKLFLGSSNPIECLDRLSMHVQNSEEPIDNKLKSNGSIYIGGVFLLKDHIEALPLDNIKINCFDSTKNLLDCIDFKVIKKTKNYLLSVNKRLNGLFLGYLANKKLEQMTLEEFTFMKSIFTEAALDKLKNSSLNKSKVVNLNTLSNLTERFKKVLRGHKEFFIPTGALYVSDFIGFLDLIKDKVWWLDLATKEFIIQDTFSDRPLNL